MNLKVVLTIMIVCFFTSCITTQDNAITDRNLIIPGASAEGYKLGDEIDVKTSGIMEAGEGDIAGIINVDYFDSIKFDSLIYENDTSALFLDKGVVKAIAGFKIERRVTSDGVLLSKGLDNFIVHYTLEKPLIISKGNNKVLIYNDLGIALFDDNSDNYIDMYLIFNK
jgi:hypothetical protein